MKKLLFLSAVCVLGLTANAQTEKGNVLLGGSVFYTRLSNDAAVSKITAIQIMPSAGYFVKDNFALGLGLGYWHAKYDYGQGSQVAIDNGIKDREFSIRPFARYYKSVNNQFKFFGNLSVPIYFGENTRGSSDTRIAEQTIKTNGFGIEFSPGFAFFPTPKIGIEFSIPGISYTNSNYKLNAGTDYEGNKEFKIGGDLASPTIGIQFYF